MDFHRMYRENYCHHICLTTQSHQSVKNFTKKQILTKTVHSIKVRVQGTRIKKREKGEGGGQLVK